MTVNVFKWRSPRTIIGICLLFAQAYFSSAQANHCVELLTQGLPGFWNLGGKISEQDRMPWDPIFFSNPRQHDPKQFKYIVHGVPRIEYFEKIISENRLATMTTLSMSVVSQERTPTFAPFGFIVETPKNNIFAATYRDMTSDHSETNVEATVENEFVRFARSNGGKAIATPDEVIARTRKYYQMIDHNEIYAVGTNPKGDQLKITGVFYKTDSLGYPLMSEEIMSKLRSISRKHDLPLVGIPPSRGYFVVAGKEIRKGVVQLYCSQTEYKQLVKASREQSMPLIISHEETDYFVGFGFANGVIHENGGLMVGGYNMLFDPRPRARASYGGEAFRGETDEVKALDWTGVGLMEMVFLKPSDIIEELKSDLQLKDLFAADAGVSEGYTIEEHTRMVLAELEKQWRILELTNNVSLNTMQMIVALHDIGKPLALAVGDKKFQHKMTLPIVRRVMREQGFVEQEITLAEMLIDEDVIGECIRGIITPERAFELLKRKAEKARMDVKDYFLLQKLFYMVDAGSYPRLKRMGVIQQDQQGKLTIDHNVEIQALAELTNN